MNNKGAVIIYSMMVGLTIIILALALAFPTSDSVERARNSTTVINNITTTGMDCNNASISNSNKIACLATEITPFWFIGTLILIGGGFMAMRVILN